MLKDLLSIAAGAVFSVALAFVLLVSMADVVF